MSGEAEGFVNSTLIINYCAWGDFTCLKILFYTTVTIVRDPGHAAMEPLAIRVWCVLRKGKVWVSYPVTGGSDAKCTLNRLGGWYAVAVVALVRLK